MQKKMEKERIPSIQVADEKLLNRYKHILKIT